MRSLEELECVSDPEVDLFDDEDVERSKLPRPRRSKSVDFSTFVECVEVPRYFFLYITFDVYVTPFRPLKNFKMVTYIFQGTNEPQKRNITNSQHYKK